MVSVVVKHHEKEKEKRRKKEVCRSELRNCVNREVLGGSGLTHFLSHSFSIRNKPYSFCERKGPRRRKKEEKKERCGSELRNCVNRGIGLGCHSLSHFFSVPDKPYSFCGRKAPWGGGGGGGKKKKKKMWVRGQELCQQGDGSGLSFPIPFFLRP